ncbi:FOPNL (predicted) [Pycnogonum litorale]
MSAGGQHLSEVLKDMLEKRGIVDELKARIRSELVKCLDDKQAARLELCKENIIINALIQEYLDYNNYKHTSDILSVESGQTSTKIPREFLESELNVRIDKASSSVPLLYSIISHHRNKVSSPKSSGT